MHTAPLLARPIRRPQTVAGRKRVAAAALVLLAVAVACLLMLFLRPAASKGSDPAAAATPDARLVLQAHHLPLAGTFAGAALRGSLYPGFPGANSLVIEAYGHGSAPADTLEISAVMQGMNMRPVHASLHFRQGAYRGTIALPMFGRYSARLDAGSGQARLLGAAVLYLPLNLGRP